MGAYSLDEIMKRWQIGKLTADQAIGQILQLVHNLSQRVGALERQMGARRNGPGGEQRQNRFDEK